MESLMTSSENPANQPKDKVMSLVALLYANREKFPMQAEPEEDMAPKAQDK